jgi:hypothetical protein
MPTRQLSPMNRVLAQIGRSAFTILIVILDALVAVWLFAVFMVLGGGWQ